MKNPSPNIILSNLKGDPFARVSKSLLNDPAISWSAKGIIAYLLGKPPDWKLRVSDIVKHGSKGKASVRSALNELRVAGYADYVPPQAIGAEGTWKISDSPMFLRRTGFRDDGNRDTVNRHLSKNEFTNNELTKSKEPKESSPSDDVVYDSEWKKNPRSKEEQLRRIKPPAEYPSQVEFETFLEDNCDHAVNKRPNLYLELCRSKWHKWNEVGNNWRPIRNWREFVMALEDTMEAATESRN